VNGGAKGGAKAAKPQTTTEKILASKAAASKAASSKAKKKMANGGAVQVGGGGGGSAMRVVKTEVRGVLERPCAWQVGPVEGGPAAKDDAGVKELVGKIPNYVKDGDGLKDLLWEPLGQAGGTITLTLGAASLEVERKDGKSRSVGTMNWG
jgi:hypothetical protein